MTDLSIVARLLDAAGAISSRRDTRATLDALLEGVIALTEADRGVIATRKPDGKWEIDERPTSSPTPPDENLLKALAILLEGTAAPVVAPAPSKDAGKSILVAPLPGTESAIVLLEQNRPSSFGEAEKQLLAPIASLAGQSLARLSKAAAVESATATPASLVSERFPLLVGRSRAIQALADRIDRVCDSDAPVLITGESGTGKEVVARTLHRASRRKEKAFVAFNMTTLPENLAESTLFGHVKGAFTGADATRPGLFELAHGSTLFLDEIGDMSTGLQAKLLRVLQEGEVQPIGATRPVKVDVRVVAATNRDLLSLIKARSFREDLYFRLRVVELRTPPLRERRDDIPHLAQVFIEKKAREEKLRAPALTPDALEALERHPWPGNVRELENCMYGAVLFSKDKGEVSVAHLDLSPSPLSSPLVAPDATLDQVHDKVERDQVVSAWEQSGGRVSLLRKILGKSKATCYRLVKKFRLRRAGESRA